MFLECGKRKGKALLRLTCLSWTMALTSRLVRIRRTTSSGRESNETCGDRRHANETGSFRTVLRYWDGMIESWWILLLGGIVMEVNQRGRRHKRDEKERE